MATQDIALSTTVSFLLFGTNFLLFILFQLVARAEKKATDERAVVEKKKLSEPFEGTIKCCTNLTTEIFITGCIIILTYIFENHWFFEHSGKTYSRDLFMFVLVLFFAYAIYTVKPIQDLTLLGRDQTEEWKGWMQFIFLLYHYFHAEEVYNSVRVMITCYVWMTGFGNFSFFYIKQDFGWLRVVQMLWRLNFSVILLMLVHGNTYILYYICPLHTFYFSMTYLTMYVWQSVNHSMWAIRVKLLVVGVIIFIIWDTVGPVFDALFFWLGTDSQIGANLGSVWEWYFRTSLDHWSTFYGMIFALNFPLAEQYFKIAKGWPLVVAAVIMFGMFVWWYLKIYSLDKLEYNLHHSYFAFIPLTAYIFFRNITPTVRSGVSMSLHALGKTTLETYLLQHHVWLTSNAKTLLTLVPGMPWVNFALATIMFFYLSKELYRLTMSLRGMILPDNKDIAFRNGIGMIVIFGLFGLVAAILHYTASSFVAIALSCLVLFLVFSLLLKKFGKGFGNNDTFNAIWRKMFMLSAVLFFVGLLAEFSLLGEGNSVVSEGNRTVSPYYTSTLMKRCKNGLAAGYWEASSTCMSGKTANAAFCTTEDWVWDSSAASCKFHHLAPPEAASLFSNKRVVFMGDSAVRNTYHQFNHMLDMSNSYHEDSSAKFHADMNFRHGKGNVSVDFVWAPFARNITEYLSHHRDGDLYVMGAALWDALHIRDVSSYKADLEALAQVIDGADGGILRKKAVWLMPMTVLDAKLNSDAKKTFMTEAITETYRQTFRTSPLRDAVLTFVNPLNVTGGREDGCADGVHYSPDIYGVVAELVGNMYYITHQDQRVHMMSQQVGNPYPHGKPTGSMSNPLYGAIVLGMAAIMLFGWDSFLGVGFLSLKLFGRSANWNDAYMPILNKIKPTAKAVVPVDIDEERTGLLEMQSTHDTSA